MSIFSHVAFLLALRKSRTNLLPFWDEDACSLELTRVLVPTNALNENISQKAWQDVLAHSFPRSDPQIPRRVIWKLYRELYHGPPEEQFSVRMDVVVVRVTRTHEAAPPAATQPGTQRVVDHRHDHLFVETKPPGYDVLGGLEGHYVGGLLADKKCLRQCVRRVSPLRHRSAIHDLPLGPKTYRSDGSTQGAVAAADEWHASHLCDRAEARTELRRTRDL